MEQWRLFLLESAVAMLCACMDFYFFPRFNMLKEGIVLFWPSPFVYCKFWGDFVVIDGESENNNKKILVVDTFQCHRLLVHIGFSLNVLVFCFFSFFLESTWSKSSCFLPQLVAYKTIKIKLETKSFFQGLGHRW